ncbi:ATP binding cassette (ABC) transporter subfamily C member [Diabrotica virgifera virgifera]|uniref:Probable multidrug resistance-associated protein lethal(2)03659 n=1 Tax=Diabrotica virgifera virgifera TaxID=50390 RepID=A0A6P7HDR7_DIAVI|nr:ATP binding cassette (ABC) transporter subfamily C member [Diabrotica virgifera virgifera]
MDHCRKEQKKTNPRETANIFSLLTFAYVGSLFKKAFKLDLHEDDIYEVLNQHRAKKCGDLLEREWLSEKNRSKKPSVSRVMWRCYGKRYLFRGFIDFVFNTINSIIRPYVIAHFVAYFAPGQTVLTRNDAYFYGCGILVIHFVALFYNHNYMIWIQMFAIEMRTAFSSLLYRKALKLSSAGTTDTNLGNIVTLITRDVQAFVTVIFSVNDAWVSITQVLVICYLLFNKVGVVSFVGIGILISVFPFQVYISTWVTKFRLQTCQKSDERLQLSQEILSTIRIIKMYTWELFFTQKVTKARKEEMRKLVLGFYCRRVIIITGVMFLNFGFYMLIMACIWAGVSTDTTIIFYILSNFRDLRHFLAIVMPMGMGNVSEFVSSYKRLVKALKSEELVEEITQEDPKSPPFIKLKEATVKVRGHEILKGVSFQISPGLTVITGPIGCGKSTLFKTILKDIPLESGSVLTQGRISYASQDPWLFPSTIRQNILFGEPYQAKRYNEVITACALTFDLSLFEHGDETILTDRGLNLSKGQQARINLARAIYRSSDIYLLDDCLTALDASVQVYIFNECIKKFLKNKSCVLVSQNPSHIQQADYVIILEDGTVKDVGKPSEQIIREAKEVVDHGVDLQKQEKQQIKEDNSADFDNEVTDDIKLLEKDEKSTKKIYSEVKKQGSVDWRVYKQYFIYGGGFLFVLFNISMRGSTQFAVSYAERLLTKWVDKKQIVLNIEKNISTNPLSNDTLFPSLSLAKSIEQDTFRLYSVFVMLGTGMELLTTYALLEFCRRASVNLHKAMIKKIINSVMMFFDTHLIGNILNRLSQDMLSVDEYLSAVLDQCCRTIFNVGGIVFLVTLVNPSGAFIIALIFALAFLMRKMYLPAGRSLKRLEAASRSPMIGHLNATLEGVTTVRASKVQGILIEEYNRHLDLYTSASFTSMCSARAFGFFIDLICSLFIVFVVIKFLFFNKDNTAGDIGLTITQVSALSISITWCVRQFTELENYMTSLERILEYTNIKTENKEGAEINNWPSLGSISYQNVYLSYEGNTHYVLKDLNFEIKPTEKIGIVGRTGAGKSSIISTLFRLYEVQGKILIDGVDIKTLSLDFLRKHIVVIPQDPTIFSGTIRSNLDPLNEFEDKDLWNALQTVGINDSITNLEQPTNSNLLTFSSGQKQLLCLARALLRKNKIIVMDEATANMDHETDKLLHKIIKENFFDCTILTIAHRLHSVLGCDKVMVLDRGEIKEFGEPTRLLENKEGIFYNMVQQNKRNDVLVE